MRHLLYALFTLLGLASIASAQTAYDACSYDLYPAYIGGGKGTEKASCIVYDPVNDLIIVGGNTTSDDFAPAQNDHGFLLALDQTGNWEWGFFFYNVSYAISDISGCKLSSNGKSLSVMGMGNSQPIVMDMNPKDGTFNSFISLEYFNRSEDLIPEYETYAGIYNDVKDFADQQNYFYAAFLMNNTLQMLRLTNTNEPKIDWAFELTDYDATQATDEYRRKDPSFLIADPRDQQVLYLIGRYRGKGSIIKFQKRDAAIRWEARFERLTQIYAVSQGHSDENIYVCGDYQPNELDPTIDSAPFEVSQYTAGISRITHDGNVKWFMTFAGTNPSLVSGDNSINNQDRCRGITYNQDELTVAVVIQSKAMELRTSSYAGNFYDSILLLLDTNGGVRSHITISRGNSNYDMFAGPNSLIQVGKDYYFTGWSYGYKSQYQENIKTSDNPEYDIYIYKHEFGRENNCLNSIEYSGSTVERRFTYYGQNQVENENIVDVRTNSDAVPKKNRDEFFFAYKSRYSGGFKLLDTFIIPRPCAWRSQNLTYMDYYRGQNEKTYEINAENSANPFTLMTEDATILFQSGAPADSIATLNYQKATVGIQTDDDEMVGVQPLVIRDCDAQNRLLELTLYVEVLSNTYPDFVTEPETTFTLAVGDVINYQLPNVIDPEGNDEPFVYVGIMDAQEEKYPPFLMFENSTNTITLKPVGEAVQGRTYYFTIVVMEKNSVSVKYSFYCTVRVTGEIIDQNVTIDYDVYDYEINYLDDSSRGSLLFNRPIDMEWMKKNFYFMFNIYWRDTNYRVTKQNLDLLDFQVDVWGEDQRTINFTMTFEYPYKIGLLLKRSDTIHINVNNHFDYSGMFTGNVSESVLNFTWDDPDPKKNTDKYKRLEMIFDFRNHNMFLMRTIAKNMYWVLIGIILVQFVLLSLRRVGLLPVWVFIEYLQLVGFMPIYNFRLIPYLYDAFKPSLVSHMIIFDETPFMPNLDMEYFNKNYEYYWLSVGRLSQSFFFVVVFLIMILIANLVVWVIYKSNVSNQTLNNWAKKKMIQFKYNAYIRFYMLAYFDTTFFSVMKIMDPNNSTMGRKAALLLSYVIFVLAIIVPVFLIAHINRRFEILSLKQAKQSFNTLLLKIDKASRWRAMNPAYFFARRLLTAMLLTLPIHNTFIFLQYVFILMSSHAYILYMVAVKPYQTPGINSYVLANETFYSALIIAIFIFSDATPEESIKFGAGVALMVSLVLLVVCNIVMNTVQIIQGPEALKRAIKDSTLKRAEKEALERAEEEERRLKKKKEEEEFTKIPDDTMNASSIDASSTTFQNNQTANDEKPSKGKKKGKKKGQEDDVVESGMANVNNDDFAGNTKKRRNRNKEKAKQDDVAEGSVGPSKSKKRKQNTTENVSTVNGTEFGTINPTQKDLL